MIGKILYPTDFSKHSLAALPLALDLAKRYEAQMHVLHAVDAPYEFLMEDGYVVPLVTTYPIEVDTLKKSAEQRLDEFVRENLADFKDAVQKAVVVGKAFAEIIHYAREQQIDLIVLGTHGHSALASMLMGNVAEKVVRKAPCPVLTVRHPEHKYEAP
ncbi:MAG: universal stress protein [Sedimentisphaerales bacterium]|nr:universal stress protein [Sedimentisphaerales bacterium]